MAPLPVITNVYRCALNWTNTAGSLVATNVIHVQKSGTNAAAVSLALDAATTAALYTHTPSDCSVNELVVTPLDGSSVSFPFLTGKPSKWSGNASSGDFIPQAAYIIKLVTGTRGRSYRGRVFLPWVAEAHQSNGVLDPTTTNACTAAWVAWLAAMNTAGFVPVVASYKLATAAPILAVQCEPMTATQRKRQSR